MEEGAPETNTPLPSSRVSVFCRIVTPSALRATQRFSGVRPCAHNESHACSLAAIDRRSQLSPLDENRAASVKTPVTA